MGQTRERLFAIEERVLLSQAGLDRQKADSGRIEAYRQTLRRALAGAPDRNSPRFAFLTSEVERTEKRFQNASLELVRRKADTDTRSRQRNVLADQIRIDQGRSDAIAVFGLSQTGLSCCGISGDSEDWTVSSRIRARAQTKTFRRAVRPAFQACRPGSSRAPPE